MSVTWPKRQFPQIQDGGRLYFHISVVNYPISIKFGMPMQISIPSTESWQKSKVFKFKMADGRHIEYRFLAISRRLIGRSTRNSERRWRITYQYSSRDQNCNFQKFMMADGRHFENSFISISQPWIIRFWSNLVYSEDGYLTKIDFFFKFKMADGRQLKIVFLAISRRLIGRLMRNSEWRWRITCRHGSRDQRWKFSQIHDGGRPPFWKQFSVFTSVL